MEKMTQLLDEYFASLIDSHRIPGCGLKVRRNGKLIYDKCLGVGDTGSGLKVSDDTIFFLASMTKPVVAAAAMILVEKGKLSLDDDLLKFFPAYPEDKKQVTVRHLLNHCSGLGQGKDGNMFFAMNARPGDSLAERIERMGAMPFDYAPGESAEYSAVVGFEILGRIIEIASGQRLEDFLQENIFKPLGMEDTSFFIPGEKMNRVARIYNSVDGKLEEFSSQMNPLLRLTLSNPNYCSGCGGLKGTLKDYDRFTTMMASGGVLDGARILSEDSITLMRTPRQLTNAERFPGLVWGLGVMVFEHPEKMNVHVVPGTFGWSGAFGTHMFINLETGLSATYIVSMGDLGGAGSPISRQIEKIVFDL